MSSSGARKIVFASVIICITLLAILAIPACTAATYRVNPTGASGAYTTICDAIDVARSGDTIQVESGTYNENVDVSKSITLLGVDTGAGLPIVNGRGITAINIMAPDVTVKDLTVTGATSDLGGILLVNPITC